MPTTPTSGASGARKRLSRLGSRFRRTSIAAQTATNAASVPAFAKAAIDASGISPANTDVTIAVKIVMRTGVPRLDTRASRMTFWLPGASIAWGGLATTSRVGCRTSLPPCLCQAKTRI